MKNENVTHTHTCILLHNMYETNNGNSQKKKKNKILLKSFSSSLIQQIGERESKNELANEILQGEMEIFFSKLCEY